MTFHSILQQFAHSLVAAKLFSAKFSNARFLKTFSTFSSLSASNNVAEIFFERFDEFLDSETREVITTVSASVEFGISKNRECQALMF